MSTFEGRSEFSVSYTLSEERVEEVSAREELIALIQDIARTLDEAVHVPCLQEARQVLRSFEEDYCTFACGAAPGDLVHIYQVATDGDVLDAYVVAETWFRGLKSRIIDWQAMVFASDPKKELAGPGYSRARPEYDITTITIEDNGFGQSITFYPFDGQFDLSLVPQDAREASIEQAWESSIIQRLRESGIPRDLLFREGDDVFEHYVEVAPLSYSEVWNDLERLKVARHVVALALQSEQFRFLNNGDLTNELLKGLCPATEYYQKYSEKQLLEFQQTIDRVLSSYTCYGNTRAKLEPQELPEDVLLDHFFQAPVDEWNKTRLGEIDIDDGLSLTFENETVNSFLNIFFEYEQIMSMAAPKVSLGIRVVDGETIIRSVDTRPGLVGALVVDLIQKASRFGTQTKEA